MTGKHSAPRSISPSIPVSCTDTLFHAVPYNLHPIPYFFYVPGDP